MSGALVRCNFVKDALGCSPGMLHDKLVALDNCDSLSLWLPKRAPVHQGAVTDWLLKAQLFKVGNWQTDPVHPVTAILVKIHCRPDPLVWSADHHKHKQNFVFMLWTKSSSVLLLSLSTVYLQVSITQTALSNSFQWSMNVTLHIKI